MSLQPFKGATDLHTHTCRGWGIFSDCVFLHCAKRYDTRHHTSDSQLLSPDRGGKARPQGSMEYGAEIQSALKRLKPVQWCSGMLSCGSPGQSRQIASLPFNLMRGICHRPSATWPSPGESRCFAEWARCLSKAARAKAKSASSRQPRQLADNVAKLQGHHAWVKKLGRSCR
ncbi:unnamed protein product [Polarella glacialis]|uniref:Uncharacterized protein n=1 Tax=Polarella glacialis TaxID=89957 RepID=A0A813LT76_POLGL|nr:unnamed protein product [Polarella glacialis]